MDFDHIHLLPTALPISALLHQPNMVSFFVDISRPTCAAQMFLNIWSPTDVCSKAATLSDNNALMSLRS